MPPFRLIPQMLTEDAEQVAIAKWLDAQRIRYSRMSDTATGQRSEQKLAVSRPWWPPVGPTVENEGMSTNNDGERRLNGAPLPKVAARAKVIEAQMLRAQQSRPQIMSYWR